ncbi:peptidase C14, caspase catalytic subunit p20 [Rhizoctonia solani 123E]|uniref:Peptidase C14, caspase catalytic subunit p20 n=1 Tax=Rhizoctonia solani 123E TaxID=1423351 RepID=A0A074RJN8_9AGAM|nr:peptidase C14, caspase catalytic subunit p20 [Rhizoctonia solani 123E]
MTTDPLVGHSSPVHCVAISSDGTRIISGSADHTVRMWDTQTGAQMGKPYTGHSSFVYGLAFTLDGTRFVSGSIDMTLKLWDTKKQALVIGGPLEWHSDLIWSVAFSPDRACLASGSSKAVLLRDTRSHSCLGKIASSHTQPIRSIKLSPCGTRLISGSDDNTVRLWEIKGGSSVLELIGHSSNVSAVAFSLPTGPA